jgi:hypothetical protein
VKITRFEEVGAWKEARVLVSMVYDCTGKEPFKKDWGLKKQLMVDSSMVKGVRRKGA